MPKAVPPPKQTEQMIEFLLSQQMRDNPLNYVLYAFPWGEKNTPLENFKGPREWQKEELLRIAEFIAENKRRISEGKDPKTYKLAISSGRGPGKSAFVAFVSLWMMSCHPGATVVVTANTDSQLTTKTFAEIGKWCTLAINGYWFERLVKGIIPAQWLADGLEQARKIDRQYWYIKGELWNEDNPDAFAGVHNTIGEMIIFDEASGIPKPIWTVSEGVFTEPTPYKFFMAFSNPRSNKGPFFDCFHDDREFWTTRKIDSRTVEGIPQDTYEQIIKKYGEDSREAKVEVRGEFPSHGDKQFISRSIVNQARDRELDRTDDHAALCMGIDPARYGDDSTVIRFRQGRDARSYPAIELRGADNMQVANKCMELIEKFNPDAIFCDSGAGSGVIDRLREMGVKVFEVQFGSRPEDEIYFDHRTELWARMRDWLGGAMIGGQNDADRKLIEDLVGPEYEFMGREEKIKLESKEKMKKRGIKSPDHADALAVTFHCRIPPRTVTTSRKSIHGRGRVAQGVGCDVKFD